MVHKILVTGGAGFIGSNLVEQLLADDRVDLVRVLDNFSTGHQKNIEKYYNHKKFEFVEGDIRDFSVCFKAIKGIDLISHQAALGSVPRSISDPLTTNEVNITGTLNVFNAAKEHKVDRVVFAASSSTYGDSEDLPKTENKIGNPLSPYAVTKLVNELYARVYSDIYGLDFIGLRYFNVFGLKQDPNGAYAAVVPLLIKSILQNESPIIHGDGYQSRDFTYIDNAVKANINALFTDNSLAKNQIYNIACGERTTILRMFEYLKELADSDIRPQFVPGRAGDVKHSLADISKAKKLLNYVDLIGVKAGLVLTYDWYKNCQS